MRVRRAKGPFEVVLTGAFLTGVPVQVRVGEYSSVQYALGTELAHHSTSGWDYGSDSWQGVSSYDTGGGYASVVPLMLVRRNGNDLRDKAEEILRSRPAEELRWFEDLLGGWRWQLRSLSIDLYDFGVGVIKSTYGVAAPASWTATRIRTAVESLSLLRPQAGEDFRSPVAETHEVLARETVRALTEATESCANHARQEPWLAPQLSALEEQGANEAGGPGDLVHREWGRLLWLHPVYLLAARPRASSESLRRIARPFRATFSDAAEFENGLFVPGIDSSAMVVRGDSSELCAIPIRLLGLNWAYYALFMEIDRGLLATLDSDKWSRPDSLRALERDAERIFATYMRVHEARARLDSALADLGGGELTLWNAMTDVAKFDELVKAVDGKVDALQRVAERRVQEAAANRARRTSSILSGLTALTVVTVAIALMGNFIGTPADALGHHALRAGVVLVAFLIAILLYREAQREITWRRRRGDDGTNGWSSLADDR